MKSAPKMSVDTRQISVAELKAAKHASLLGIEEVLPDLISPDTGRPLTHEPDSSALSDGTNLYPRRGEPYLLLPSRLQRYFTTRLEVPFDQYADDPFMQYFLLATIKQSGEINAAASNIHYERHLVRLRDVLANASGTVLDVGCDDPEIGASLFPPAVNYIGLDPFCSRETPFRLIGVGEYLPFRDASLNGVLFNTSLDHIHDWHRALDEAHRVLLPGGKLYLSTLAWTESASLQGDSVHFHHFREYEILGALEGFEIPIRAVK